MAWKKKLSDQQVFAIRYGHPELGTKAVAELYGVTRRLVKYIRAGKRRLVARVGGRKVLVTAPLPVAEIGKAGVLAWYCHRANRLLAGYLRALEREGMSGEFLEGTEELEVDDGLGGSEGTRLHGVGKVLASRALNGQRVPPQWREAAKEALAEPDRRAIGEAVERQRRTRAAQGGAGAGTGTGDDDAAPLLRD